MQIVVTDPHELQRLVEAAVSAAVERTLRSTYRDLLLSDVPNVAQKDVLTHKEVARYVGEDVLPNTVIRWIKEGGLLASKRGRNWYVRRSDLEDWLMNGKGSETWDKPPT